MADEEDYTDWRTASKNMRAVMDTLPMTKNEMRVLLFLLKHHLRWDKRTEEGLYRAMSTRMAWKDEREIRRVVAILGAKKWVFKGADASGMWYIEVSTKFKKLCADEVRYNLIRGQLGATAFADIFPWTPKVAAEIERLMDPECMPYRARVYKAAVQYRTNLVKYKELEAAIPPPKNVIPIQRNVRKRGKS